jgi:hypothetical protein
MAHISKPKKHALCWLNYFRSSGAVPKSEAGYLADSTCFTHALLKACLHTGDLSGPERTCLLTWSYTTYMLLVFAVHETCLRS